MRRQKFGILLVKGSVIISSCFSLFESEINTIWHLCMIFTRIDHMLNLLLFYRLRLRASPRVTVKRLYF
jgi:hypothetical protein